MNHEGGLPFFLSRSQDTETVAAFFGLEALAQAAMDAPALPEVAPATSNPVTRGRAVRRVTRGRARVAQSTSRARQVCL